MGHYLKTNKMRSLSKETQCFLNAIRYHDQLLIECDLEEAYRTQLAVDRVRDSFRH